MSRLTEVSTTYKPFAFPEFVNHAIDHESMFWGEWEASLQRDVNQWKDGTITPEERNHITQILRLFTQSDQIVGGSYVDVFLPYFKNNEVRMALLSIANRESTHMRAYALLNDTLGLAESEYRAFLEYEEMADKAEFMQDFETDDLGPISAREMGLNLARTVMNEGMSLFSAFVQLLNYQRPEAGSKMLGMCEIVEWSVRDETKHVEVMAALFRRHVEENPEIVTDSFKRTIYEMYRTGVDLEDKFIELSFAMGGPKGITKEEVKQYIRFVADRRLTQLGLKPNWGIEKNPLPWVDHIIGGDNQKNFFEGRVTDYNHKGMEGDWGWD
jgi:ribonucleoside-diphosphate reductase beta chain